jgi:hypothetical protein
MREAVRKSHYGAGTREHHRRTGVTAAKESTVQNLANFSPAIFTFAETAKPSTERENRRLQAFSY